MHTTKLYSQPNVFAHHNADLSGDAVLIGPAGMFGLKGLGSGAAPQEIDPLVMIRLEIPFEWLEKLVAQKRRSLLLEKLEQASDSEILYGGLE